jgi:hypothetical protein
VTLATDSPLLAPGIEQWLVEAFRDAEAYRAMLSACLTLLREEQLAHAQTRTRYAALLDEYRATRQRVAA